MKNDLSISVICPLYKSENYVVDLYFELEKTLKTITNKFEIIYVNDASPDNSLTKSLTLFEKVNNLKIIDLSYNFGQHKALITGIKESKYDLIFIMDADLEEDPKNIIDFVNEYESDKSFDLIYGVQKSRKGGFIERYSGWLFYFFFNKTTGLGKSESPTPFRLMTRKYANSLCEYKEYDFFFHGLSIITGYKQKAKPIEKENSSKTSYSFVKKIKFLTNSITSFSSAPLKFIFGLGLFFLITSFVLISYHLYRYFIFGNPIEGWSSLFISIWFFGGLIMFSMGIIGIYLSRIFIQVKNRPFTVIKDIYEKN